MSSTWIVRRSSTARPVDRVRGRPDRDVRRAPSMLRERSVRAPRGAGRRRRDGRSPNPCLAEPRGVLGDGVHDRLEVGRRARDDPQDLAVAVCCSSASVSSRLPGSRSSCEQAHVLDGDHRLVGEGLEQLDLLVGERPRLASADDDDADGLALPQHRDAPGLSGSRTAALALTARGRTRIGLDVGDVDDAALEDRAPESRVSGSGGIGYSRRTASMLVGESCMRDQLEQFAVEREDVAVQSRRTVARRSRRSRRRPAGRRSASSR